MVDKRTLYAIQDRDPDGGSIEPTDAAYAAHEDWAVRTYGRPAWDAYRAGSWDDPADWQEGDHSAEFDYADECAGQLALWH